jgi:RecA/RadA recombinase
VTGIFSGYCAYIDAENAFNPSFAEAIGVDSERLLIAQPDSAENSLSIVNTLIGGSVAVVVVDSVCYFTMSCLVYFSVMASVPCLYKEHALPSNTNLKYGLEELLIGITVLFIGLVTGVITYSQM